MSQTYRPGTIAPTKETYEANKHGWIGALQKLVHNEKLQSQIIVDYDRVLESLPPKLRVMIKVSSAENVSRVLAAHGYYVH